VEFLLVPATPLARSRPQARTSGAPGRHARSTAAHVEGGDYLFFRRPRMGEPARPFGDPAQELPKAHYCDFDESCAGSPAFDAPSARSAEDDGSDESILASPCPKSTIELTGNFASIFCDWPNAQHAD
jgi:hypothetical protein